MMRFPLFRSPVVVSKFSVWWFGGGGLSIFLPLISFGVARIRLHQQQQNNGEGEGDGGGEAGYNTCHWWQWGCNTYYQEDGDQQQQQNNNNDDQPSTPWWWFFADEETRRKREESQSNNPALVFVYVWSLVLFCAILYFGHRELRNGSDLYRVVACLAVFANFSFLTMFLIGGLQGVETEGRELEEQGFYAQFSVMMFLSNFYWTLFAASFALFFTVQARRSGVTKFEFEHGDYQIHEEVQHQPDLDHQIVEKDPVAV